MLNVRRPIKKKIDFCLTLFLQKVIYKGAIYNKANPKETMEATFKNIFSEHLGEYIATNRSNLQTTKRQLAEMLSYANDDDFTTTKNVNSNTFRLLKKIGLEKDKIKKVKIMNIMPELMCHINCLFIKQKIPDVKVILGLNMTACECGCFYTLELHSVLKYKGELYDITKDFNKETHKYFIELTEIKNQVQVHIILNKIMIEHGFIGGFIYSKEEHRCLKTKNKNSYRIPPQYSTDFNEEENYKSIRNFLNLKHN